MLVRFHGELGDLYLKEIELEAKNIQQIIQIMDCNFPGFERYFIDRSNEKFEILMNGDRPLNLLDSAFPFSNIETVDFYPAIGGSGRNPLMTILGGALVLGAIFIPGFQIFGASATQLGFLGGAMALKGFFGAKKNPSKKDLDNKKSNLFNGAINASGNEMVPIIVGRIKTGSIAVSMDIKTFQSSN